MPIHITKNFSALEFVVVAQVNEYDVEFSVFDIKAFNVGRKNSNPSQDIDVNLAQRYLHGWVKWDGCSDFHFDEQERHYLHGCSRQDILRIGEIMATCWDWASELLPSFEGD